MIYKNALIGGKITDIDIEKGKIVSLEKQQSGGVELDGRPVFAGLIDIHCHGLRGLDTMDGGLAEMTAAQAENGVTSWLPTTMTMSRADIAAATVVSLPEGVIGFHLEGPFVSEKYCGAQRGEFLRQPDIAELESYRNVRMITLAPELSGSSEFIRRCVSRGIAVSLGHTACGYDEAVGAFEAGAVCVTHLYNAMPPFLHREPGLIGAAIDCGAYAQLICDGLHVAPSAVKAAFCIFGDRLILISDCLRAAQAGDGEYSFGGQKITVRDGRALTPDGKLAGSTTPLFGCVKKAAEMGIPFETAMKAASENPARLLGLNKGRLKTGFDADFIVLDGGEISMTVRAGEICFRR